DAKSDVLVLEALFERLYQKVGDLDEMVRISQTPSLMKKFTFGKYKENFVEEIAKTDRDYLSWLYEQKLQDPLVNDEDDWLYTLKFYLDR
ncbi:MAG: hypothetical protein MRY49_01485, partial [Candidatus Pacebacteria bacterium]|nr:hypothetical protein [Candidatus Paceibacterota bacterium]